MQFNNRIYTIAAAMAVALAYVARCASLTQSDPESSFEDFFIANGPNWNPDPSAPPGAGKSLFDEFAEMGEAPTEWANGFPTSRAPVPAIAPAGANHEEEVKAVDAAAAPDAASQPAATVFEKSAVDSEDDSYVFLEMPKADEQPVARAPAKLSGKEQSAAALPQVVLSLLKGRREEGLSTSVDYLPETSRIKLDCTSETYLTLEQTLLSQYLKMISIQEKIALHKWTFAKDEDKKSPDQRANELSNQLEKLSDWFIQLATDISAMQEATKELLWQKRQPKPIGKMLEVHRALVLKQFKQLQNVSFVIEQTILNLVEQQLDLYQFEAQHLQTSEDVKQLVDLLISSLLVANDSLRTVLTLKDANDKDYGVLYRTYSYCQQLESMIPKVKQICSCLVEANKRLSTNESSITNYFLAAIKAIDQELKTFESRLILPPMKAIEKDSRVDLIQIALSPPFKLDQKQLLTTTTMIDDMQLEGDNIPLRKDQVNLLLIPDYFMVLCDKPIAGNADAATPTATNDQTIIGEVLKNYLEKATAEYTEALSAYKKQIAQDKSDPIRELLLLSHEGEKAYLATLYQTNPGAFRLLDSYRKYVFWKVIANKYVAIVRIKDAIETIVN